MTRFLLTAVLMTGTVLVAAAADDPRAANDTPKAANARKLLQTKISVNFIDTKLADVIDEIKEMDEFKGKGLSILLDTKGGVSRNQKMTFKADNVTLAEVFDGMFKKNGLGYIVISGKNNGYDGSIQIKQGKERGFPEAK